jgi:hypothetical protein
MSLSYKFLKAEQLVAGLTGGEAPAFRRLCHDIRQAQADLVRRGQGLMAYCREGCGGLCCRNVIPDDLITQLDVVFAVGAEAVAAGPLADCLRRETIFTADCIFLTDGVGPCLFPGDARPERCLITFCGRVWPIRNEIRRVRSGFNALSRFLMFRAPKSFFRILKGTA